MTGYWYFIPSGTGSWLFHLPSCQIHSLIKV